MPIHTCIHAHTAYEHIMTQTWLHSRHCTHLTHIHTHEDAPTYTQPVFIRTLQTNTDTNTQTYIHTHPQIDTHTHTHTKAHQHSAAFTRETLLHARAFRQRHVYTEQLLHIDYTQSSLVTKSSICTDQLLLRDIQRPCYMGQLLDERLF